MTDARLHEHALQLWVEVSDFLLTNATDMSGMTALPELRAIADRNAKRLLEIITERLRMVVDEARS